MVAKPDEVKQIATQAVTAGVMRVIATVVDPQTAAKQLAEDVRELPSKALGKAVELPMKAIGQLIELQSQVAELPKVAAGLPLKLALQAVATGEKVRNLLPGHGAATEAAAEEAAEQATVTKTPAKASGAAAWDAAAPKPDPAEYTPPVAGGHTAQLAKVTRTELKAVPDAPAATAPPVKKSAAKTAPAKASKAPAKAPAKASATPAKVAAKSVSADPVSEATHDVLAELAEAVNESVEAVASVTPIHGGRDGHVDTALPNEVEAAVDAAPDGAALSADELPIAGYGGLSITQIRARISKLDAVQLVQLRDYERAHADRTPIVTMLETKLAKVTGASATTVDTASTVSSSSPGETATLIAEAPSNN